jgi:phosphosulfolactate synthase (CoM biosynthesis protein A)
VNPLTDDIVGNRKALVVDLVNLYRSEGQSDQAAVETLSFLKRDLPELAAIVLASFPEIGAASVLSAFGLSGLVQGTAGADNLSANTSAIILGGLGNDTIVATEGSQFILGGSGADILQGGVGSDTYLFSAGDGNDVITDHDLQHGNDRLIFTDLASTDVTLSRSGEDLRLTFTNGETVTIRTYLSDTLRNAIESIEFADGVTWTHTQARQRLVSDMKATGVVVGTEHDDTYYHASGDGSYSITDYDWFRGNDRLIFTDLASTDVGLSRSGEDLRLTFTNGETITIRTYLGDTLRNAIESIEFADGVTWTHAQARHRLMTDMKATGAVVGTEQDETYYHASGDGSYSITDYDWHRGNDRLIFTDLASTDVTLSRSGEDLRLSFANGETITIKTYLSDTLRNAIESIEFADGVTWTHAQARHRLMTDMKATGAVVGTEQDEIYYHTSGDGSYSVTDYDRFQGNDHFVFSDARSTDVLVQRRQSDPNDVVFTLASGDRITLLDQLVANNRYGVERIFFSDGVGWTRSNLLSAPIVDDNLIYA